MGNNLLNRAGNKRAKRPDSLSVVVPIYNEESSLAVFLDELIPYCQARGWAVILVDDGSRDATPEILATLKGKPGVTLLRHKVNRGYGGALKTGLLSATSRHVVTIDADGQHSLANIDEIHAYAMAEKADLVVGQRGKHNRSGWYRNLGKWLIRKFAGLLMPMHVRDLNSGFKHYRTVLVQRYLSQCPDSMAFSDVITMIFITKRHLVLEHPIQIRQRAAGKSKITTFTAVQTLMEILHITMLFNPLRIFLPISVLCIGFGFAWGIPIMLRARGVSVGAMLAIVTGLLFFFIGLIAEQLSAIRMGMMDKGPADPGSDEEDE